MFQKQLHPTHAQIRENIGLGNPALAHDADKVREAARLGGAEALIDELPEGFNTYLDRPVRDYYSDLPEGTTTLFGRPVDYSYVRNAGGLDSGTSGLSGGQMQRLAVYATVFSTSRAPVLTVLTAPVRSCARWAPRQSLP